MSFLAKGRNAPWYEGGLRTWDKVDPLMNFTTKTTSGWFAPKVPAAPQLPNPNDAANAAQATTDSMRMRRGMLANIYAGATSSAPVTGKTQLGT
jgi:hypothetical protein